MSPDTGLYIVRPVAAPDSAIVVGPTPRIFPPADVTAKVSSATALLSRWFVTGNDDNTVNVFEGSSNSNNYKWIVKNDVLWLSSQNPNPDDFRFESAGNNQWTIAIPNEDKVLTYNSGNSPPLIFKPADGSEEQRFTLTRIDRSN